MNLIIHRGGHEIGGSCVELATAKTRIIVDFGMPLVTADRKTFDARTLQNKSIDDLKEDGILPNIKGLYKNDVRSIDAILLSHSHLDHYGLLKYVHPEIPIYMSEGAKKLIEVSDIFTPNKIGKINAQVIAKRPKMVNRDITVTPYLVDHSAFDALAFLIEGEGKRVFYSGDFRGGGWKGKLFDKFISNPPQDIDCLLMEGTMIDRGVGKYSDEKSVFKKMTEILGKSENKIVFAYASGQNIDRIVSFYKAARKTKSLFVMDPYTACVLNAIKNDHNIIPQLDWNSVRVFIANYYGRGDMYINKINASSMRRLIPSLGKRKIKPYQLSGIQSKALMMMRDSMIPAVKQISGIKGSTLVYSLWKDYLNEKKRTPAEFWKFMDEFDLKIEYVHTSGHAVVKELQAVAKALKPKKLIPIHTFKPNLYSSLFDNVTLVRDGERIEL